jgi:membrane protease YdiL (CAAX protease family)
MTDVSETAAIALKNEPVAPWWHTVLVLMVLGGVSVRSAMNHGLPGSAVPGLDARLSKYLLTIAMEWFLVLFIWMALKGRGLSLQSLVGGRWATVGSFFKDLGLGCVWALMGVVAIGAIAHLLGGNTGKTVEAMLPKTVMQMVLWVAVSATAGFCEEFIFRGYLMRQFGAWSGSAVVAVIVQGLAFGLAHGYYLRAMIGIVVYGWLLGLLAHWRKSLRPGMLAHGLQDTLAGLAGFLMSK